MSSRQQIISHLTCQQNEIETTIHLHLIFLLSFLSIWYFLKEICLLKRERIKRLILFCGTLINTETVQNTLCCTECISLGVCVYFSICVCFCLFERVCVSVCVYLLGMYGWEYLCLCVWIQTEFECLCLCMRGYMNGIWESACVYVFAFKMF